MSAIYHKASSWPDHNRKRPLIGYLQTDGHHPIMHKTRLSSLPRPDVSLISAIIWFCVVLAARTKRLPASGNIRKCFQLGQMEAYSGPSVCLFALYKGAAARVMI